MEKQKITAGIDIGTYHVKVVIARQETDANKNIPTILGRGTSESKGLRYGYIINPNDVIRSIQSAVKQAEESAGISIKKAFVSIGGIELSSLTTQSSVIVSRADSQINDLDMEKVQIACEHEIPLQEQQNRKIIHSIPIAYRIDGRPVFGDPTKMKGMRLECRMLFISCLEQHLADIISSVEASGIDVIDVTAAPLAAGYVTLSKQQRTAGVVLANIGAETMSIVVYENNLPISLEIFPIGSTDITNDIALGLKVSLEEAEQIKIGKLDSSSYPKKKLDDIVRARLSDMFDLVEAHLKKIGRNRLLPAGIVITGGGSGIGTVEDLARSMLDLPSRLGTLPNNGKERGRADIIRDSSWSVAYGLCLLGFMSERRSTRSPSDILKAGSRSIKNLIKQFLP